MRSQKRTLESMLSEKDIRERLDEGKLSIFPFDPADVHATGIALRLGSDFAEYINDERTSNIGKPKISSVPIGDRIQLLPNSNLVGTSLQFISMPPDLAGIILPRSSFERFQLMVKGGMVSPGFRGKLAMPVFNLGTLPISIYPGAHIATLALFAIRPADSDSVFTSGLGVTQSEGIESIRRAVEAASQQVKSSYTPPTKLVTLLDSALNSSQAEKGKRLEIFTTELLKTIEGLKVIKINARLRAEELDIIVQNDLHAGFWRFLGSPIIVECKNWSGKVGAREISILGDKLATLGPDSKTGILIAPNGISGDATSDAWLKVREWRIRGKNILVLDNELLAKLKEGQHPAHLLEEALQTVWLL